MMDFFACYLQFDPEGAQVYLEEGIRMFVDMTS